MAEMEQLFGPAGPLAAAFPDYRIRPSQIGLAEAIHSAVLEGRSLIAEAGTGTGKTFAYLVPAMLSGGKAIVSTGTKTLQDQLFSRDIPLLRAALKVPVSVALLKGRANYLCHHHIDQSRHEGRFRNRIDVEHLNRITAHLESGQGGDIAGLPGIPESSGVWPHVTSTRDNCLGQDCGFHAQCFVLAARKAAQQADLVVVNHHLFFADLVLRDEGAGELLPQSNTVILDEAHLLPDIASTFLGSSFTTTQVIDLGSQATTESLRASLELNDLVDAAARLEKSARDLRLSIGVKEGRFSLAQTAQYESFRPALENVLVRLDELKTLLDLHAGRSEGLHALAERVDHALEQVRSWTETGQEAAGQVRWVECFSQSLHLNATPLSLAKTLSSQWEAFPKSWIFTSATLSVKGDFRHYQDEMGLADVPARSWDSPFDYATQGLLYVPTGLPQPNDPGYTEAVVDASLPVLKASHGRAFLLFTSHRALNEAHGILKERIKSSGLGFSLLVQGEAPRTELLNRFRRARHPVLLGTGSFWEGVDVKGDALTVVIIDKIPFAPPDDPVTSARIEFLARQGSNAFMTYQLPRAVITLKQGAGRLIRDEHDRGVLMLCDPRMLEKSYGRRIWMSLPPMKRTREEKEALEFLDLQPGTNQAG